ncbi:GNAT family N-acetyltransferase [Pseudomarimonas arenosa]|uniref:GNAT family N-acetyltransferase n=1 Tax=Pseudomarimonas arenosa TaxID=2774145 RepID=A0AAW3ZFC3_9GAMM|nr:GNAT family N-acetyltransferase [Pseudomarimonas arenosa]MBD8524210.1 GNAT family N-acetyltransferase [Pseudomarimonas arenosa]
MRLNDRVAAVAARLQGLAEFPRVESKRLQLRGPGEADISPLFDLFSDPEVMRYWSRPAMRQHAEASHYIADILGGFARREFINWIIADRQTDQMCGTCTLYALEVKHLHCAVGYAVLPRLQGRGYAQEAVAAACRFAEGVLGFHRVEADVHPDNLASKRVLLANGFVYEGRLRQRFVSAEEIQDSDVFGRVAQDSSG